MSNYQKNRSIIKDGDLLLWQGESILARLIRLFGQTHNHASFAFEFNKADTRRVMLYEALSKGIEPEFLSARIDGYRGNCWLYPLRQEYSAYRDAIYQAANRYGGVGYDYKSLFKNILGRVSADADLLFCSEYIYISGIDAQLPVDEPMLAPRPDDLLTLNWWESVGILLTE